MANVIAIGITVLVTLLVVGALSIEQVIDFIVDLWDKGSEAVQENSSKGGASSGGSGNSTGNSTA